MSRSFRRLVAVSVSLWGALLVAGQARAARPAVVVDSLQILEKAVARDSTKFDNLWRLGVMYLDRERPVEATRIFTKASRLRPKNPKVLVNLGIALDASNHSDLAQQTYRQAMEVSPGDSIASCRLASSLYAEGKHQESVDVLRETIRERPGAYCAYFTLGVAFADAGIYRDAIRMWKKVIETGPNSPEAASAKESIEVLEKFVQP